jgi:flagellar biosynthesis/type III secretory pathway protein FliH
MAGLRRQVLEASEGELVELALAIAERVILREVQADSSILVGMARDAIETLAAKDEVVIAVARDVPARVPAGAWDAVGVEHTVQVDPQLAPGGVEVRTPQGIIAATPEARLNAVAQALDVGVHR